MSSRLALLVGACLLQALCSRADPQTAQQLQQDPFAPVASGLSSPPPTGSARQAGSGSGPAVSPARAPRRGASPAPAPADGLPSGVNATAEARAQVDLFQSDPPQWGGCFYAARTGGRPSYAPARAPYNSSVIIQADQPDQLAYLLRLQAALLPGDYVTAAYLTGNISSLAGAGGASGAAQGPGPNPIAYLYGPLGRMSPPRGAANGEAPWVVAQGLLYSQDVNASSGWDFYDLPAAMSGWSTVNSNPVYVVVDTKYFKGALIAGYQFGLQPMNAAAIQFVSTPESEDVLDTILAGPPAAASGSSRTPAPARTTEFAVNLTGVVGVDTDASGVASFVVASSNRSLSWTVALEGLASDTHILNLTFWRGAPQPWPRGDNMLFTQRLGVDNGYPLNPPQGVRPTVNGTAFVLSSGYIPDAVLVAAGRADEEELRYNRALAALEKGSLYVAVATRRHPGRLLGGFAGPGHAALPDGL